jgi:hypothetical protein
MFVLVLLFSLSLSLLLLLLLLKLCNRKCLPTHLELFKAGLARQALRAALRGCASRGA